MKTNPIRYIITVFLALTFGSLASAAGSTEGKRLQVRVDVPHVFDMMVRDEISETVGYRLRDVFDRRGFEGDIVVLDAMDKADEALPLLEVRLLELSSSRTGIVDCRMLATLTTPDGDKRDLGRVGGFDIRWSRGSGWENSRAFERATDTALRELWDRYHKLETTSRDALTR